MYELKGDITKQYKQPQFERKAPVKIKHKKVYENLAKGDTKKEAILKAGYSMATAKKPSSVINSKSFQTLLNRKVHDNKLIKVLDEGLEACKITGKLDQEYPDHATRHKYLETGLKLKGHTIEEKEKNQIINIAVILDKLEDKKA